MSYSIGGDENISGSHNRWTGQAEESIKNTTGTVEETGKAKITTGTGFTYCES